MPKSSRPPDSRSSVAACSASSTGLCHGSTMTAVPSRKRRGARAEPGQQVERRRDLAIAGEMVLDDKGAAKPEPLGLDIVVDEVAKPLAAVELGRLGAGGPPRRRAAEQTEPHRAMLLDCLVQPSLAGSRGGGAMFKMPVFYRRHKRPAWRRVARVHCRSKPRRLRAAVRRRLSIRRLRSPNRGPGV